MNWYKKSSLIKTATVTLYHGTTLENARSIMNMGLMPQVGSFVEDMYGSEYAESGIEFPEVAFAADKRQLQKAVNAMIYQVGKKLGKKWNFNVNTEELKLHGAIVVFQGEGGSKEPPSPFEYRPDDEKNPYWDSDAYPTVEPEDYFTEYVAKPDFYYSGNKLIAFLRRNGFITDKRPQQNRS